LVIGFQDLSQQKEVGQAIFSEGMPLAEHVFYGKISNPIILGDFSITKTSLS